mmetsp:Transcript_41252/g.113470  ORF Transcript_41252/g.113470 Transcript_41252/m.113470 type:complete len:244 (-) Transcript_41252:704-1435(-)
MALRGEHVDDMLLQLRQEGGLVVNLREDDEHAAREEAVVKHAVPAALGTVDEHCPRVAPVERLGEDRRVPLHLQHAVYLDGADRQRHERLGQDARGAAPKLGAPRGHADGLRGHADGLLVGEGAIGAVQRQRRHGRHGRARVAVERQALGQIREALGPAAALRREPRARRDALARRERARERATLPCVRARRRAEGALPPHLRRDLGELLEIGLGQRGRPAGLAAAQRRHATRVRALALAPVM